MKIEELSIRDVIEIMRVAESWLKSTPEECARHHMEHRKSCPDGEACVAEAMVFQILEKQKPTFADAVKAEILVLESANAG